MINLEFTERINALRRELIDAIIAELNCHGVTSFEFPDDVDRSELPWQTVVDKNGEPRNGWVTKLEIWLGTDLMIHADDEYDTYRTSTNVNYEAREIDFLAELYENLQYYLNHHN